MPLASRVPTRSRDAQATPASPPPPHAAGEERWVLRRRGSAGGGPRLGEGASRPPPPQEPAKYVRERPCAGEREGPSQPHFQLFCKTAPWLRTLGDPPQDACDQPPATQRSPAPQAPALELQTFQLHPLLFPPPWDQRCVGRCPQRHSNSWFLTLGTHSTTAGRGNSQLFPQLIIDVKV